MATRKVSRRRRKVKPEDAKATKRFFTITGIVVLAILILLFIVYSTV